jgi:hypothetical protein
METSVSFSNYRVKKNEITSKKKILENIFKEYELKRNNFNPSMKSPNHFANRLQQRMRLYYSSLTNC